MANEIHVDYPSGNTLYFIIRNSSGQAWDTTGKAFEAWNTMGDYDITLTDKSGSRYVGSFDTNLSTAGRYSVQVFLQSGASPADTDLFIGGREIFWSGTAEQYMYVNVQTVLNATPMSEADVNEQVDNALDTAITSSPTAESINERLDATGAGGF